MAKSRRSLDGRVLREEFLVRGWGIAEAAKKCGISQQTLYRLVESDKPVAASTEAQVIKALAATPVPSHMRSLLKGADNGYGDEYGP